MLNVKKLFNDGWMFSKQRIGSQLEEVKEWDEWELVEIPHDWLIFDTTKLYETGEGRYKKRFKYSAKGDLKRVFICFGGVYMDTSVFVNGILAGEWKYGYSTFEVDVTDFLVNGENEICVRVVFQAPNSRWYSGAGIYRNVWIKEVNRTHIVSDGIYITPIKQQNGIWSVQIDTEICGSGSLIHTVYDAQNKEIAKAEGGENLTLTVNNPLVWSMDTPNLYTLKTELYENGEPVHTELNRFGFRTIEFDANKGFLLNGEITKIHGVCQHHDLGCLGAAVNKTALKRQLEILREMGANAVRTAHNMPAAELMELADEMGFLICSEAFDMWERPKTSYDYGRFFGEWVDRDVASWIRRDRNCPSVIMWSIGNEIYDTHASERGQEITKMLAELVRKHDPKNHAPITIGSNYMPWENAQKCADIVKLAGYNYAERLYNEHHEKYPDWIIYGSETSSTVQSRGIYHFPLSQSVLSDDDEQCSSLGNSATSWGAQSTERCITDDRDTVFSPGQFIWSGFDYIGEPTPYATKNSYFGQVDTAGFKKDSFYIYQSEWTDYRKSPMVHIFPYWDFSQNQMIDVRVCSNAPKIKLFFNDEPLGVFDIDHLHGKKLIGDWQIPYKKGTLHAVALDENGVIIAEDIKPSFGDAARILLKPNKHEIMANGSDLVFVEISVEDENGFVTENANNRVSVTVEGAGRLIGLDNGDSTDFDQYKGTSRRLFSGKLLAVIGAKYSAGEIKITVRSEGFETQELMLTAVPAEVQDGVSSVLMENKPSPRIEEIPVRKIELSAKDGTKLNAELSSVTVRAEIYPKNATYTDLEWRVTDKAGIDSVTAKLEVNGSTALLTAIGDGEIYVRCMTKNGGDKIKLISQLGFTATGLGEAYINPYAFVAGGLYNASNVPLTNGNDRGVATLREDVSHVGFRGLDFGDFGADEITIPIFAMSGEPFPLEIWEGMPNEAGSGHLCTVTYTSGSIWNTYRAETYKLPRRLRGVTTLCFVVNKKIHIKGFSFKKLTKAYEQLSATEYTQIYGDAFVVSEDAVEKIGNNVTIVFGNMDLGEASSLKLQICGRTPLDANMIQIKFDDNTDTKIIEFLHSEEYTVQTFSLENVMCTNKITFIFLPGCNFDFKWFKFS